MFRVICWLFIGLIPFYVEPRTLTGTLRTDIVTGGGDCGHRWWLQPDISGKAKSALIALEPDDKVPPELNKRHVRVKGEPKTCHGVEGTDFAVIVVESIEPIEE